MWGSGYLFYGYGWGSNSKGIYVSVPYGNTGLYVSGGTKNALVPTSQGARELYTEESTEVWFSDYGFATLDSDKVLIDIDPLFAETVSLDEPYHVFVQPYGDAVLYVRNRETTSFEVHLREGDSNVEFSYRLVAKRKGYEQTRLEHAPIADNDPHLYPEKSYKLGVQNSGTHGLLEKSLMEMNKQRKGGNYQ